MLCRAVHDVERCVVRFVVMCSDMGVMCSGLLVMCSDMFVKFSKSTPNVLCISAVEELPSLVAGACSAAALALE